MAAQQNPSVSTRAKRSIQRAFLALLEKEKVDKITIAQLTREADVNKSTFYRYYTDIYDLRDEILDKDITEKLGGLDYYALIYTDTREFIMRFQSDLKEDALWWKSFLHLFSDKFPLDTLAKIMSKSMRQKLYGDGLLAPTAENDEKVNFLSIMMGFAVYFYPDATPDCILDSMAAATSALFSSRDAKTP